MMQNALFFPFLVEKGIWIGWNQDGLIIMVWLMLLQTST